MCIDVNYELALECYSKAYELNDTRSCYAIGKMYLLGVEKNYDIGIEFYKKSYIMDVNKEYTNDLYINIINN